MRGFNDLVRLLSAQIGNLVNVSELSVTVGLAVNTLKKYLDVLSGTYVASLVRPFSRNVRAEITKMPKVYLQDMGLRNYLSGGWSGMANISGAVVENFVYLALRANFSEDRIHFYRTLSGGEIDFVIQKDSGMILAEVKYRTSVDKIPVSMKHFASRYHALAPKSIILTKDTLHKDDSAMYIPVILAPFVAWDEV